MQILHLSVAKFSDADDYNYVLAQGPWLINDHYLMIHKWVPNRIPDEEPVHYLIA